MFHNNVYDFRVHLIWPVDSTQFRDYVRKIVDPTYRRPGSFVGICWHGDPGEVFDVILGFRAWKNSQRNLATLAHEVLHATQGVLTDRGMRLNNATCEAYAYLQESIFYQSLRALNQ